MHFIYYFINDITILQFYAFSNFYLKKTKVMFKKIILIFLLFFLLRYYLII